MGVLRSQANREFISESVCVADADEIRVWLERPAGETGILQVFIERRVPYGLFDFTEVDILHLQTDIPERFD